MFFAANAGKRSLALDLRTTRAARWLRLAERTDVFVQSLRPGAIERLGLGPPTSARATTARLLLDRRVRPRGPLRRAGLRPADAGSAGMISVTGEPDRRRRASWRLAHRSRHRDLGCVRDPAALLRASARARAPCRPSLYETALALFPTSSRLPPHRQRRRPARERLPADRPLRRLRHRATASS